MIELWYEIYMAYTQEMIGAMLKGLAKLNERNFYEFGYSKYMYSAKQELNT